MGPAPATGHSQDPKRDEPNVPATACIRGDFRQSGWAGEGGHAQKVRIRDGSSGRAWHVRGSRLVYPSEFLLVALLRDHVAGVIPAKCSALNLDSRDNDLVRDSLGFLASRADPVAVPEALQLLHSSDDYIWVNAAEYLGACHRQEAIPYLIKALRHTAWRSDEETVRYLRTMTGQPFGAEFDKWHAWWTARHPGQPFDWTSSLGLKPRVPQNGP